MWLGAPRRGDGRLDAWGAATLPATGCLCLQMPQPTPWENLSGRPSVGLLGALAADIGVLLAVELSERKLPAALAAGLVGYAMQAALDAAQPAYLGDWSQFGHAAASVGRDTIEDYISAMAAGGPLVPVAARSEGDRP